MHQDKVGQAIMGDSVINEQKKSQVLIYCLVGFKLSFHYLGFQESNILTDYVTDEQNI